MTDKDTMITVYQAEIEVLQKENNQLKAQVLFLKEQLVYKTRVREVFVVGDTVLYDEILPISEYPIAVACNEHAGTPYPSGDVRHAKTPQRMLNRTEALIISHTNATTNFLMKEGIKDGY